jgi:8-oxo-dGTP diphosphatase
MPPSPHPRVGVGVLILRHGHLLLGQRLGDHGPGTWAPPGGHLDFGETPEECGAREVLEETGLVIEHTRRGPWVSNLFSEEGRHAITLFLRADVPQGEPELREPDKCADWRWVGLHALPQPLFAPLASLLHEHPDAAAALLR